MLRFSRSLVVYAGIVMAIIAVILATAPVAAKTPEIQAPTIQTPKTDCSEPPVPPTPKEYLYATYPKEAPLMDRIITCESGWKPAAKNIHSTASGLAQFLASTWSSSRAKMGLDPDLNLRFDPISNIDTAIWLLRTSGPTQWQCYTLKMI